MTLPEPFPLTKGEIRDDRNPAIRLFGKRFIGEQNALELAAEFLAVAQCAKRLDGASIEDPLPPLSTIQTWRLGQRLYYRPPIKLNLKLFAFLAASRLDTRHDAHLEHYKDLVKQLRQQIDTPDGNAGQVVEWLEDLLRGFQGAGFNRTWCAQTFFPISRTLLIQETLWNETTAARQPVGDWHDIVRGFHTYFSVSKHRFLARGGELLYLQLCNVFAEGDAVRIFARQMQDMVRGSLSEEETDLAALHGALQTGLAALQEPRTAAFDRLIDTIEALDPDTSGRTNPRGPAEGWLTCEWCPRDSWPEGYLFAVELSRVLRAAVDPVERLELLVMGSALHMLRSLCAQSVRHGAGPHAKESLLGYAWLFTPPEDAPRPLRLASQRNLQVVQRIIYDALRSEELRENAKGNKPTPAALYSEADRKYGHKLLLSMGKKLRLIAPYRGRGARFVMTDRLLRYLVLALLRPGERCTYESFLKRLYLHYGIAVQGAPLDQAAAWSGVPPNNSFQPADSGWLASALRAGGFLTELSDACSIVRNNYRVSDPERTGVRP